jgi:hypothetical protein
MKKEIYNGFSWTRPDGEKICYTIVNRSFNTRPYAVYVNGDQLAMSYIYRGTCERSVKELKTNLQRRFPDCVFSVLIGPEIVKN